MAKLPKETNYWKEAEEFFALNKDDLVPGSTKVFKEKIVTVSSYFGDEAFIDLIIKVSDDGQTFSLIPLIYNDTYKVDPADENFYLRMTEYFNDDIDRSLMSEIRMSDFTEDIIRIKENYNIPLSKEEGDYLQEVLGDSLDEADVSDIVPKEELVVAPDDISSIDTPTNVVDDIKLTGTTGGITNVRGDNIAYVDVEELFPYVQYDRRLDGKGLPSDYIDNIKKTIYEKGFMYDTGNEGVNVFGVFFDDTGNIQINEGNHRLRALYEVAQETGQKIYVPINPFITKITGGNKIQNVSSEEAYNVIEQLIRDLTTSDKIDTEYTISDKLGEPGRGVKGLESYTYPGGAGGTKTNQNNIKKFFNSIGINAITYDELPDNNIYKTGVNTFTDTPTNVADEIAQLENSLNEKYSDVLEFNYNAFGDEMESTKPLQIGLREDGVLGIDVISVSDSAQGQGYGSSIMNEIIEFADKNNLEIQLEPLEGQEDFFKKLGFEQFGDDEAEYRKLPKSIGDNIAQQLDVQDIRIYFNEAYQKFGDEYMPYNFFERFLIDEKGLSEDVAKGIISDIKTGLTKPEFPNVPKSTFNPEFFPNAGTNFDTAINRGLFNSSQVQREISEKYVAQGTEDYLNLPLEKQNQLANNFYEGINPKTTGTVEFYVQQQSPNRILAGDITSGLDMTHQIPGFYTEPIGNRDLAAIRGTGSNAPINNYYKVQANTDNLLIDIAPGRFAGTGSALVSEGENVLGRQINKIDWDIFTKETGVTYEMLGQRAKIIDGQKYFTGSVQDLSRVLRNANTQGNVWEALRKSGIEGFVTGPTNVQYEIVLLDPNDNLGIGKKLNIEDTTIQEFQSNQAKVNQLDELVITPTSVIDDVVQQADDDLLDLARQLDMVEEGPLDISSLSQTDQDKIKGLADETSNVYNVDDIENFANGNQIITPEQAAQLEETTGIFTNQVDNVVSKTPLDEPIKQRLQTKLREMKVRWGTWSGPLELLDIYETGVLMFYGIVAAYPELKSYSEKVVADMYDLMLEYSGMDNYGLKKINREEYRPNWEYIGEQLDKAEAITPTDLFIKTVGEAAEAAGSQGLATGFGYIPPSLDTRKKLYTTITSPKSPEKEDEGPSVYDKIKTTFKEWYNKPIEIYGG